MNRVPAPLAARFRSGGLAARLLAPVLELGLPKGTAEVVVRSGAAAGIRLSIDPQHEKFYWTGAYERGVQQAFQRLLRPGDLVWDVGAHIGFFTALAARSVGPQGRVYSFEPEPENRLRLLKTLELNGLEQVEVLSTALSDRRGIGWLYPQGSTSTWTLVSPSQGPGVEVPCATLDELFSQGSLGTPTLVKIDAEDAELDILRGGIRLVNEAGVTIIVELNSTDALAGVRSLLPGHRFEALSDSHWLLRKAT